MLSLERIKSIIPHRDPMLMVDEADDPDFENLHITGRKHVTGEEELLHGHFPGHAVMPGVMMIESLAQLGAILVLSMEKFKGKLAVLGGVDRVKFRNMVHPGDVMDLDVQIEKLKGFAGIGHGKASVNGKLVCEGTITFFIIDPAKA